MTIHTTTHRAAVRSAFTLVELMIAVLVLGLVMAMVGVIYKASGEAVSRTNATTELQENLNALKQQLTDDLRNINRDGFLVIVRREFAPGAGASGFGEATASGQLRYADLKKLRADQLLFWRHGDIQSKLKPQIRSSDAMVYYSHMLIHETLRKSFGSTPPADRVTGYDGDDTTNDADNFVLNRWAFGRQQYLYAWDTDPGRPLLTGVYDVFGGNVTPNYMIQRYGRPTGSPYQNTWSTTTFANFMAWALGDGNTIPSLPEDTGADAEKISNNLYKMLLQHCGSVRIRMMMATEDNDGSGIPDTAAKRSDWLSGAAANENDRYDSWPPDDEDDILDAPDMMANVSTAARPTTLGGVVVSLPGSAQLPIPGVVGDPAIDDGDGEGWLDLPEQNDGPGNDGWVSPDPARYPIPTGSVLNNCGAICFTPDVDCVWPVALEFTIRLYDKNLALTSFDKDQPAVSGSNDGREHCGQTFRFIVELGRK